MAVESGSSVLLDQLDLTLCIDAVAEEGIESLQAGPCHVTISEGRPVMQLLSEIGLQVPGRGDHPRFLHISSK